MTPWRHADRTGPGSGSPAIGGSALAHRRLSIIDLTDAGAQPMATADGRLRITFNGEIYNYRELRKELEGKGYRFLSNSDTEVLLHLYAERGPEMVHALQGMYAFGISDDRDKSLFLARDPFGIKPLYVADDGRSLRFASQVKALLKAGCVDTAPEPAGAVGFLVWGYVPEPYTLYRNIRALPAGAYLRVSRAGRPAVTRFFDVRDEFRRAEDCRTCSRVGCAGDHPRGGDGKRAKAPRVGCSGRDLPVCRHRFLDDCRTRGTRGECRAQSGHARVFRVRRHQERRSADSRGGRTDACDSA